MPSGRRSSSISSLTVRGGGGKSALKLAAPDGRFGTLLVPRLPFGVVTSSTLSPLHPAPRRRSSPPLPSFPRSTSAPVDRPSQPPLELRNLAPPRYWASSLLLPNLTSLDSHRSSGSHPHSHALHHLARKPPRSKEDMEAPLHPQRRELLGVRSQTNVGPRRANVLEPRKIDIQYSIPSGRPTRRASCRLFVRGALLPFERPRPSWADTTIGR